MTAPAEWAGYGPDGNDRPGHKHGSTYCLGKPVIDGICHDPAPSPLTQQEFAAEIIQKHILDCFDPFTVEEQMLYDRINFLVINLQGNNVK